MKVLLDHHSPILLAHGGFGLRTQQTRKALAGIGIDVDFLKWWDDSVTPDLIHFFGKPSASYLTYARLKGIKTVVNELHSGLGSRPHWKHVAQGAVIGMVKTISPGISARMGWNTYEIADAMIAQTNYEADLMCNVFHAPRKSMHVIPGGVNDEFFEENQPSQKRSDYLISTVVISERKRPVELAVAAGIAKVPVMICGKPYSTTDPYYKKFLQVVEENKKYVTYKGPISERRELAQLYGSARGFVLLSTQETLSLSSLEASAAGCPLLITALPWATSTYQNNATYCPDTSDVEVLAADLKRFYENPERIPNNFQVLSWKGVAERLRELYASLL